MLTGNNRYILLNFHENMSKVASPIFICFIKETWGKKNSLNYNSVRRQYFHQILAPLCSGRAMNELYML